MNATIHVPSATVHIGAVGYHRYASEFLGAYERFVAQDSGFTPIPYFLVGHAIELAFKSFLVARGIDKSFLKKKLGHHLIKGLNKAKREGLDSFICITGTEKTLISRLDKFYHKKDFEYFEKLELIFMPTKRPSLDGLGEVARKLIVAVEPAVMNATSTGKIGIDGLPCN